MALIETVRVIDGVAPLWSHHLERLRRSAAELGISLPPLTAPQGGDDRVVRFEISDGAFSLAEREVGSTEPLNLVSSPALHRGYRHKTTERSWLDAARTPVTSLGADDALLMNGEGMVVEATQWAIGWWDGERLIFPPLELGGLPSVARARMVETVRGGVDAEALRRDELAWRALVACNAARGLVPVASLDGEAVPGNQRTTAVAGRFWRRTPG